MFGARGSGFNPLKELSGAVGGLAGLEGAAESAYDITSLFAGSVSGYKILKTPNQALFRTALGGEKGGVALGRLQGLYGGANSDKFTIFSIVNNSDQSIVRIVKGADGADGLYLNARIVGTKNMLRHEPITNYKKVIKGLFELAQHGWKQ